MVCGLVHSLAACRQRGGLGGQCALTRQRIFTPIQRLFRFTHQFQCISIAVSGITLRTDIRRRLQRLPRIAHLLHRRTHATSRESGQQETDDEIRPDDLDKMHAVFAAGTDQVIVMA